MINKTFKGGRGKKAPYETTLIRSPLPIKTLLEIVINGYKLAVSEGNDTDYINRLETAINSLKTVNHEPLPLPVVSQEIIATKETVISLPELPELPLEKPLSKKPSSLTNSQANALKTINQWLKSDETFFRLSGYAGTGKSFLMSHVLRDNSHLEIIAAAPTNKAAKNLKKILSSQGIDCEVLTIAKLLHQLPEINETTGKEDFKSESEPDFSDYDLIIFDEFSMIGKDTFKQIQETFLNTKDTKGLFLGDPAQIPPVNEKISPIAPLQLRFNSTLTEVVRYDGEIGKVAEEIRSNQAYNGIVYPFKTTEDKTIICIKDSQYEQVLREYFVSDKFRQDSDYIRLIAFRNIACLYHNQNIRKVIYGDNCKPYEIGDILITKSPLFRKSLNKKGQEVWKILINNSEEMKVTGVYEYSEKTIDNINYGFYEVPIITLDGLQTTIRILTPESKEKYENQLKKLGNIAKNNRSLWKNYYELKKLFDDVTFAYCLTCHKAQGSSIENTILDLSDLARCHDKQQMIYTALTRTKQKAFILQ
jgi:hypothetical protein